ncbi:MAG: RepB family plasmid replication initiator protein [Campylobacterota bacterium]
MGLQNVEDYIPRIKEAMQELRRPIELNNFYHPLQKRDYDWYSLSFIDEVGFPKNGHERAAQIKVNSTIKQVMQIEQKQGGFTKLDILKTANKFRTKYAMKLYEYLKSFESYYYLQISDDHLRKLLSIEDVKTYKYFSDLVRLIERQMKDIRKKSELGEVAMKANKEFKFLINKKSKKNADKAEAKTTLDSLVQKF